MVNPGHIDWWSCNGILRELTKSKGNRTLGSPRLSAPSQRSLALPRWTPPTEQGAGGPTACRCPRRKVAPGHAVAATVSGNVDCVVGKGTSEGGSLAGQTWSINRQAQDMEKHVSPTQFTVCVPS